MEQHLPAFSISPIDGRYAAQTEIFKPIFSEYGLMKYRLWVEVEYLLALASLAAIIRTISTEEKTMLRSLYQEFSIESFNRIKEFEKVHKHDVKAVEYFLREKMQHTSLNDLVGFVHLGRTSEDINNLSYALMIREGVKIIFNKHCSLADMVHASAKEWEEIPLLARTHGQPATPTTLGWEMKVFTERLVPDLNFLKTFTLSVKWNGATGGDNALWVAYPNTDWKLFSQFFIESFNKKETEGTKVLLPFKYQWYTTQIEPHDTYRRLFDVLKGCNSIWLTFSVNMWMYISNEIFTQKPKEGESGSSAMPHKVNPIDFENAEGNLGMANALFEFFSNKLPHSRLQRDLADSTVERNFGAPLAHTLIALNSLEKGFKKLEVNRVGITEELEAHWEVITEAYQVILRREGVEEGYELLKKATRGKAVTKESLHTFVDEAAQTYNLSQKVIDELKSITPHNYIGNRTIV